MTRVEFLWWIEFYKLHPFDDLHRIHRPAALVATSMSGADTDDLLDWLEKKPAPTSAEQQMAALGLKKPRKE